MEKASFKPKEEFPHEEWAKNILVDRYRSLRERYRNRLIAVITSELKVPPPFWSRPV